MKSLPAGHLPKKHPAGDKKMPGSWAASVSHGVDRSGIIRSLYEVIRKHYKVDGGDGEIYKKRPKNHHVMRRNKPLTQRVRLFSHQKNAPDLCNR